MNHPPRTPARSLQSTAAALAHPLARALAIGVLLLACRRAPAPADGPAPVATPVATTATTTVTTTATTTTATATTTDTVVAPVRTPAEELATFRLPPGYRMELVAAEPLVQDPIAIDFDADGRMWVVEMRAYMPNVRGEGEDRPVGRVVVVEDTDDDGRMDRKTVFLDSLVLPRALKVLSRGTLVAAPPYLWLARDTTGDLRADVRELVRSDYGDPQANPEHNANGLLWGIDNWIHSANWEGQLRLRPDGGFALHRTPALGQWGVSSDAHGRLFRNSNEDPLRADLVPSWYAGRTPNAPPPRGVYERLTPNVAVWPGHRTPAVNRGYRPETLRPDSTLAHYTSAGSPTVYLGDRLPADLRGSVFVTEPAGNLVGRFVVDERADGAVTARTAYERAEFLTSTDERFRPVNLATAPDGTLYVVDMYRGIIQHRVYITGYLEEKIKERGLEQPIGLGRVWRVVHESARRGERPRLASAPSAELVRHLAHPNGWWRTTAQRLLVERRDRSVADTLRALVRSAPDDVTRLHALWTLDGVGESDPPTIEAALRDRAPHVRAAALRVAEPWLARAAHPLHDAVLRLVADDTPLVRRQLAASVGELAASRRDRALLDVAARHGGDPIVGDLVASAARGRELALLERLLARARSAPAGAEPEAAVRALAGAVVRAGRPADVQRLLATTLDAPRPRWQRVAVLGGANVRGGGGNGGGRGPRGAGGPLLALPARPAALLAAAADRDTAIAAPARAIADALSWPGKGTPAPPTPRALGPAEEARFAAGRQVYASACAGCHQAQGTGLAGVAKPLAGSRWVTGPTPQLVRIVQHGKEGEMLMPPLGAAMTDDQLAAVLTYVRRAWGNAASPVTPAEVREVRGATMGRARPWTEAELQRVGR